MTKCDVEARFNSAQPFYTSSVLYVIAFLVAVFSWLKWPGPLGRTAFWLMAVALVGSGFSASRRLRLEGPRRPPPR